jgi:predicted DNA-binding transcriptional regulator YafY
MEETADSLTVRLNLTLNYELESMILSFSDEVEILNPAILKEKIRKRICTSYQNVKESE